jgi:hypothetical protein
MKRKSMARAGNPATKAGKRRARRDKRMARNQEVARIIEDHLDYLYSHDFRNLLRRQCPVDECEILLDPDLIGKQRKLYDAKIKKIEAKL